MIPNKAQSHSPLLQDANGYSGNRMQRDRIVRKGNGVKMRSQV